MSRKPFFIGFVGHSGSGKTTLIEKLIKIFARKGYRVGAIKHDAHKFEIDYPGKDSYRMKHAGACRVVISSKNKLAMVEDRLDEKPFDEIKAMFSDCDIVFVEGYKLSDIPKIEVHRKETGFEYLIESGIEGIALIATNEKRTFAAPSVDLDDVDGIVGFIENLIET